MSMETQPVGIIIIMLVILPFFIQVCANLVSDFVIKIINSYKKNANFLKNPLTA